MPRWVKITAAAVVGLLVLAVVTSHRGGRAVVALDTLECRWQWERTLFGTGWPLYRSPLEPYEQPMAAYLLQKGLVMPDPAAAGRELLFFHWNDSWRDGDGPFYNLFARNRHSTIEWCEAHPECAQLFFAELFRLLRSTNQIEMTTGSALMQQPFRQFSSVNELRAYIEKFKQEVSELLSAAQH